MASASLAYWGQSVLVIILRFCFFSSFEGRLQGRLSSRPPPSWRRGFIFIAFKNGLDASDFLAGIFLISSWEPCHWMHCDFES